MKKYFVLPFLFFSCLASAVEVNTKMPETSRGFIENKGQIHDQHNQPNRDVLYLLNTNGLNVQIKKGGFAYDTYVVEKKVKEHTNSDVPKAITASDSFEYTYKYHRIDIDWVGCNPNAEVVSESPSNDYTNYYNVTYAEQGILHVRSYKKITVKNIYAGIDVEYVVNDGNFKYNFIVHPGADYKQIQVKYEGAPLTLVGNKLQFELAQGMMEERIPKSWYQHEGGKTQAVSVSYKQVDKNVFEFTGVKESKDQTLVIDPNPFRLWGTYYGGSGEEGTAVSLSTDPSGNVFLASITTSNTNIATSGAYQTVFVSGNYCFLVKFTSAGVPQWGTYYGGGNEDDLVSSTTDPSGNVYIAGITASSGNIATPSAHQTTFGGSYDVFLAKFSTSGAIIWATYYGGNNYEGIGVSCTTDANGNVFLASSTQSTLGIATPSAHQITLGGGADAFVVKFNSNGVRQWGTYYGGTGDEYVQRGKAFCTADPSGNIYLSSLTTTTTGTAIATTGSHQSGYGGSTLDAFLVKFNTNGVRQWGTYYGGNNLEDFVSCVADPSGNVFLTGITGSTTNIATTTGVHQATKGANNDVFIAKFNTNGVRQWGTYFGGDEGHGYSSQPFVDATGNLFLTGDCSGNAPSAIATTGAFQTTMGGGAGDGFIVKFNTSGVRQWGSYIGGSVNEYYLTGAVSGGSVYVGGTTTSTDRIATAGAYQTSLRTGGGSDAFVMKFQECAGGTLGTMTTINAPSPTTVCSGVARVFSLSAAVTNAVSYNWTVPSGWTIIGGQGTLNLTALPSTTGTLSVRAYNSCGDSSTTAATRSVTITASPAKPSVITTSQGQLISGVRTLCNTTSATFSVTNVSGNTYQWTMPSGWTGSASTTNTITRTVGTASDTIRLIAVSTTTTCPSDTQKLFVRSFQVPTTPVSIIGNAIVCVGKQNTFSVDSVPYATSYIWTIPTGWTFGSVSKADSSIILPTPTSALGSVTVTARNFCGASSSPRSLAITSNTSVPAQPTTVVGSSSVCGNTTQTYSVSAVTGVKFRWVLPTGWTIQSGDSTNQITVVTSTTGGVISVYPFQIANPICEGPVRNFSVSVSTTPNKPGLISGDTTVCASGVNMYTISSVPNATSYVWTLPSGAGWSGTSTTTSINVTAGITTGNFVLKVKAANSGCSSLDTSLTINVSPAIGALSVISGSASVCANSSQQYSISKPINATTYTWSLPGGWAFNGRQDSNVVNTLVGSSSGSSSISVIARNSGCVSSSQLLNLTINAAPNLTGNIIGSTTVCPGVSTTYSISAASGATSYTWTKNSAWTGTSTTNTISITPTPVSDTLRVIASNGSCNSVEKKLYIAVSPPPAVPAQILGTTLTCINSTEQFRVAKVANATSYNWTYPAGWSGATSTTDSFVYVTVGNTSGTLSVASVNSAGCASTTRNSNSVSVSTTIPNAPTTINGGSSYCPQVSKTISVPAVTGATSYLWTVPSGWAINSGQNTSSITVTPNANTGIISVQTVQGGCKSGLIQSFMGSARTKPAQSVITLPGGNSPCANTSITLSCTPVSDADSYTWSLPSGWSLTSVNGGSNVTALVGSGGGNITVLTANDGCSGTQSTKSVTVSTPPVVTGKIEGETYVKSNTLRKYYVSGVTGSASYNWAVAGTGWSILSGANEDTLVVYSGKSAAMISVDVLNTCGSINKSKNVFAGVSSGLTESELFSNSTVYPIPASNNFTLSFSLRQQSTLEWEIVNMLGQQISRGSTGVLQGGVLHELPFSSANMSTGMYQLNITNGSYTECIKLSIIK